MELVWALWWWCENDGFEKTRFFREIYARRPLLSSTYCSSGCTPLFRTSVFEEIVKDALWWVVSKVFINNASGKDGFSTARISKIQEQPFRVPVDVFWILKGPKTGVGCVSWVLIFWDSKLIPLGHKDCEHSFSSLAKMLSHQILLTQDAARHILLW